MSKMFFITKTYTPGEKTSISSEKGLSASPEPSSSISLKEEKEVRNMNVAAQGQASARWLRFHFEIIRQGT